MYLTVQQLRVEVEVLSVDMPEDSDVLGTPLDRKRNGERITVSPREVVVLGYEIKRSALYFPFCSSTFSSSGQPDLLLY